LRPQGAGDGFETTPDDVFGEIGGGADVPDELVGLAGGADEFGQGEFGFAEAAAGYEDAEAFGGLEDPELIWV
jgi:hypothetical protein